METIEIENDGPTGSNSTDPYTSDILTVQSECNQMQQKICQLEEQNQQLQSDKNMLERTLSGFRMELAATQAATATLSQENAHLENQLRCAKFGAEDIRDDDAKTCFYTGLPTFTLFITLFDMLKGYAPGVPESKGINKIFAAHFSTIFHKWLRIMYHNLRQLIMWPDTETLRANLPQPFRKHYSRVKCIIDCLEISFFCGKSSNLLELQEAQYS